MVVRLSAPTPAAFTHHEIFLVLIDVRGYLSRTQGHSTFGMKNSSDTIGKQNRDLPVCGVMPHPIAPPHASMANECEYIWSSGGIVLTVERVITGGKGGTAVQVSLGLPQIPRGLSCDLPRTSVV